MKQKKGKMNLGKILGAAYGLCFGGLLLLAVGCGIQYRWDVTFGIVLAVLSLSEKTVPVPAVVFVLCILGIVGVVSGIVLAYARMRCPHCDASLMQGGRLPFEVPNFCPNCGKPLE